MEVIDSAFMLEDPAQLLLWVTSFCDKLDLYRATDGSTVKQQKSGVNSERAVDVVSLSAACEVGE